MIGLPNWLNKFRKVVTGGGGGGSSTSYANKGGTGNRTAAGPDGLIVTVVSSGSIMPNMESGGSTDSRWVDGTFSNGQGFFSGGAVTSSAMVTFDFGSGKSVVIDEAKYYQQDASTQGTWKWQGSNDGSTFTDIGSSFTLGGVATQTIASLSGNTTAYRYYRMIGVSGTSNGNPWVYEMEFKISGL